MNTCFDIGNQLCERDDAFSHSASYAITLSPGYRFHHNAGATLDIGIGALTPTLESGYGNEDEATAVSTLTVGATLKGFMPLGTVELVGGVGAGMMTISGNGGAGDYTWSGTSLKLEGGLIYGSMGGTKGIGVGGIISYHLGLGGDLSGDGGDAYKTGENPFEDGSPYFDLLQFSLAVSYGF